MAGELQSFAISPSYGGPYAGIIATKEKFIRQMPGRLVGQTTDSRGNRAFCLTLATREQHIRREKATSNICTNQALIALMATVFMTVYGKQGLRELAEQNLAKAHYLAGKLKPRFSGKFFNEFVVQAEGKIAGRGQQGVAEEENHRRPAAGPLLSGTGRFACCCAPRRCRSARGHGRGVAEACWHDHESPHHISQNEALLFERSSPGKKAYQLPELDVPAVDAAEALGAENVRAEIEGFPEVSEVEAIRHFTRLSTWNYAIDYGMYPLGSCTMKYNPRINELVARIEGLAWAHPYQPEALAQGCDGSDGAAGSGAGRNHRHGRGHAAARGRRARRADRHPADPRAARKARQPAQEDPDSRFGARHQPRHRGHRRLRGGEHQVERDRRAGRRRAGAPRRPTTSPP